MKSKIGLTGSFLLLEVVSMRLWLVHSNSNVSRLQNFYLSQNVHPFWSAQSDKVESTDWELMRHEYVVHGRIWNWNPQCCLYVSRHMAGLLHVQYFGAMLGARGVQANLPQHIGLIVSRAPLLWHPSASINAPRGGGRFVFAGQQVESFAPLKQMEGVWTLWQRDLIASDGCMCKCPVHRVHAR